MILQMRGGSAGAHAAAICAECGAQVSGNFCSACGADQRTGVLGVLGDVTAPVRHSFPWVYLKILRAPVQGTVALADDRAYRSHVSFLLSGIAVFCLLMIPILLRTVIPASAGPMSESLQTYLKVMSQVGVYVGAVITFLLAYALFRYFAKEPRTLKAYFKLYCLAFGFVMPLYAAYEFLARNLLGGIGMSSLEQVTQPAQFLNPLTLLSIALALLLWAYFVAIHRRFWHMPLWKATALYVVVALSSSKIAFWLMFVVSAFGREVLVAAGVVTV